MTKKYIYYFSLLVVLLQQVQAQENPHLIKQYNFVQYDSNYLHFYNDSASLQHFYNQLDELMFDGSGKVNIMQIGGSHIQADIWSDQLRKNFHKVSPNLNGGRGFLFPFKLAKTNNPYYYEVNYTGEWQGFRNSVSKHHATWGVSGITAITNDSVASFSINFRGDDTPPYDFNRLKIFHNQNDSLGYCLELTSDSCDAIFINDSIGFTEFVFKTYKNSIEITVYKNDSASQPFELYGISLENNDPGVVYHSIGVNGASTSSYLRATLFKQHLQAIQPDLVIFCIGINDAYDPGFCGNCYENNYDTLVDWIQSVSPKANFIFVTNNDSYYKRRYPNKRVEEARAAMIRLADKHNAAMWDMYHVMGGLGSIKTWQKHGLAKTDKIHLTSDGYKLMGDLLFSAIMKGYADYAKQNTSEIVAD